MKPSLNWKELEILKIVNLKKEKHKTEIIKELKNIFPFFRNTPNSSFYLMFDRLNDEGLISIDKHKGSGHKAFVNITDEGRMVITESMKTAFDYFLPTIVDTLITEIGMIIKKNFKDFNKGNLAIVAPDMILSSPEFQHLFTQKIFESDIRPFNIQMSFSGYNSLERCETIKSTDNEIPLKDDFFSLIVSFFSLGFQEPKYHRKLLREYQRVLKKKGRIMLIEVKYIISIIKQSMVSFIGDLNPIKKDLKIDLNQFRQEELQELMQDIFPKSSFVGDFAEILISVGEK
ncbi:MAG: methyltransferase domain-containing protein [Candidatus Heimdallarchaeaceae archaeon]